MSQHCHHCHNNASHSHHIGNKSFAAICRAFSREIISGLLLLSGAILSHFHILTSPIPSLIFYLIAVLPVAVGVIRDALRLWSKGDFMNEFTLMLTAAAGAFILGEYPEGVAVLLFYCFGEKLEDRVSDNVRDKVKGLMNRLPDVAIVVNSDGTRKEMKPADVPIGSTISVFPGQRVPLDGILASGNPVDFDTAAITGEAVPRQFVTNEEVSSGMIPVSKEAHIITTATFSDSSMSRIMKMIEDASATKSPTENILRRITRWYTPLVFILAVALILIPWIISLFGGDSFSFDVWFRRSLVFLVCSCPCALVVSIPLSYFMAIGTASARGILFKGSRYIDAIRRPGAAFFDKTGTLTTGKFRILDIIPAKGFSRQDVIGTAAAIDASSSHPLAQAILTEARRQKDIPEASEIQTVRHGMSGIINGKTALVGSTTLLKANGIDIEGTDDEGTMICVALAGEYIGRILLEDSLKPDVPGAIYEMHRLGVEKIAILSGDREKAVAKTAIESGADEWHSALLPEQKQRIVSDARRKDNTLNESVIFAGDGINDAPAIAAADVGIAMGQAGTAIAMQSADIVIAGDDIAKVADAIRLARRVRSTVFLNVSIALGIKVLVMTLGAFGIATLWAAVFADTGVTLITILLTILSLRPEKQIKTPTHKNQRSMGSK